MQMFPLGNFPSKIIAPPHYRIKLPIKVKYKPGIFLHKSFVYNLNFIKMHLWDPLFLNLIHNLLLNFGMRLYAYIWGNG
jgi:hypothetical protein